jgi:hypothetical protein
MLSLSMSAVSVNDLPMPFATDVDSPISASGAATDVNVWLPNPPFVRGSTYCPQCEDRDWVWSTVVHSYTRLAEVLSELEADETETESDDELIVHMAERDEMRSAPLRAFKRAVYLDFTRMRTDLEQLNALYAPGAWQRLDIALLKKKYEDQVKELDGVHKKVDAQALYQRTLRKSMWFIHSYFTAMSARCSIQSQHDNELIFRAKVAVILLSNTSALEPSSLREFCILKAEVLRHSINALQSRLVRELLCHHSF